MNAVFAFVALKACGCVAQAATTDALAIAMRKKSFREQVKQGKIVTVMSREEWDAMPWKCPKCEPARTLFDAEACE